MTNDQQPLITFNQNHYLLTMAKEKSSTTSSETKRKSRRCHRNRSGAPSGAKKRLESMIQEDKTIAIAALFVFLLSAVLSYLTIGHLENHFRDSSNPILEGLSHKLSAYNYLPIKRPIQKAPSKPWKKTFVKQVLAEDIKDIETLQSTFPIHAAHDLEEIEHPGILFADPDQFKNVQRRHPELPMDAKIKVPKFWRPKVYGEEGVREFLGGNGKRLITPEEAHQIGSRCNNMETIYISVASYRDPECRPTVDDIFLRADYPDRIRVAIIDQRAEGDTVAPCAKPDVPCDEDPEQSTCKYAHLIDSFEIEAPLSIGPVFARHLANRMYRGEYFAMQIDSHVRFIEHWDSSLTLQWRQAKNEMGVITTYLSDINGSIDPVTHENRHPNRPIMCKTDYEGYGKLKHLRHGQQPEGIPGIHGEPTLHPFWAAGFSFGRGHFVVQVPYDQYRK
jgi:hypothetical protein